MLPVRHFLLFSLVSAATLFLSAQNASQTPLQLASPNGQIVFTLTAGTTAQPALRYSVDFRGKRLIDESELGLDLQGQRSAWPVRCSVNAARAAPTKPTPYRWARRRTSATTTTPLIADFQSESGAKFSVEVRAFDDGVAFRYLVPEQPSINNVRITGERTQFRYSKDATLYPLVVNGFQSSYEDDYQMRTVSGLHHDWLVALPLLAEVPGTGWVAITEANIDNYAGMYLRSDKPLFTLKAELSPNVDVPGVAVDTKTPFKTPWRVLMIGDAPGRLIESNIILNLNPPSKIADTSWIRRENPPGTGGRATPPPASASPRA